MVVDFLIKYIFRIEPEMVVFLGSQKQKGSLIAIIKSKKLWQREKLNNKIKSLLQFNWTPSNSNIELLAKEVFMHEVFGPTRDYGEELFRIISWHNSKEWDLSQLTDFDLARASALDAMSVMTRLRHRELTSAILNLNLAERAPSMCMLVYPMVVKIPIVSFQYFLDVHSAFAFNSIRRSKHPYSDEIISYFYETIFIQQKIAISLHEYIRLVDYTERQKQEALFINAELNAIMGADLVFSYLKASIEKIIILIGLTFGINNIESKKTHKSKIDTLLREIPLNVAELYYYQFIFEFIKSENLDELNNYRSGLLHKKGISDLQPHNYVGEKAISVPLKKIFQVLIEQHSKNTAVLLGALALLTDELVKLDPPSITIEEIIRATTDINRHE